MATLSSGRLRGALGLCLWSWLAAVSAEGQVSFFDPTPAAFGYFSGRFANGPTAADVLNQRLTEKGVQFNSKIVVLSWREVRR